MGPISRLSTREIDTPYSSSKGSFSTRWTRFINQIEHHINNFLRWLCGVAARNPRHAVTGVILLSLVMVTIGLLTNFNVDVNDDTLWTPVGSKPVVHMQWIDSHIPSDPYPLVILVHRNGDNVITQEGVHRIFEAVDTIQQLPSYHEICATHDYIHPATNETTCEFAGMTNFWNDSVTVVNEVVKSDDDVRQTLSADTFPDGRPVDLEHSIGFPEKDANGILQSGTALRTILLIPAIDDAYVFLESAVDALINLQDKWSQEQSDIKSQYHVDFISERSVTDEMERAIVKDIPLVPIVFLIMSVFTCFIFFRWDPVESRMLVGFGAVVSVLLAIMCGYGILFIIGVPFTSMTQILPFIMFGIGLDDAFIITGAYARTSRQKSPIERVDETIDTVGLSITLTTVTSVLAFGLGCISSVPAVYWLCLYAFPTLAVNYLFIVTFFIAIIVIDEHRIMERRRDVCIWIKVKEGIDNDTDISIEESLKATQGIVTHQETVDEDEAHRQRRNSESSTSYLLEERVGAADDHRPSISSSTSKGETATDSFNENITTQRQPQPQPQPQSEVEMPLADRIMLRYADYLLRPTVKSFVILVFSLMLAGFAYSASKLEQEFKVLDIVPSDSYIIDFFDAHDVLFSRGTTKPALYFRDVDQSDPEVQKQMQDYVDALVGMKEAGEPPAFFWLRDFKLYNDYFNNTHLSFYEQLDLFLAEPIVKRVYGRDIVRDPISGNITASRVYIYFSNFDLDDVKAQINLLLKEQRVTAAQPVNEGLEGKDYKFFSFVDLYNIWQFYAVAVDELIFTTVMGVAAVTIVSLVLIPHWTAAFFTLPLISILYIDLMGFLQMMGAKINAVSYIALVMSIGLLVDFVIHVLLRYYECKGTRNEKVRETLRTMGSSILIASVSTFLGIIPLSFSSSVVFGIIFNAFLGLVVLGALHGLVLLPVVLSIIGPEDCVRPIAVVADDSSLSSTEIDAKQAITTEQPATRKPTTPRGIVQLILSEIEDEIEV